MQDRKDRRTHDTVGRSLIWTILRALRLRRRRPGALRSERQSRAHGDAARRWVLGGPPGGGAAL